jgi:hypothetical protein
MVEMMLLDPLQEGLDKAIDKIWTEYTDVIQCNHENIRAHSTMSWTFTNLHTWATKAHFVGTFHR